MKTISSSRVGVVVLSLMLLACSKNDAPSDGSAAVKPSAAPTKSGDAAMKDMPGMEMKAGADTMSFTAAQIEHGRVKWTAVTMSSSAGMATAPGELTVNEDRTARLGAPGRGRIVSVRVQPGDAISRGQPLLVMQSSEAGMAQSDVVKATAEVAARKSQAVYAASARARAERLLAIKAIPRQDLERAIADDEQATAALAQSNAELARARSASEQLGSEGTAQSGEIVLRSPIGGVVLERPAQPGAVVDAGAPLVVVTDPSTLWLQVRAAESLTASFRRGGQLTFTVPAFGAEAFTARIDAVAPGLDPATRTLAVRAVIANAGSRLKSSMLATVRVEGNTRVPAVLLPDDAVQLMDGKPTVFIAHPVGSGARFERRTVEVGARSVGRIAVLRGLTPGDVVVTSGAFAVKAQFQKASMPAMEM